MSAKRSSKQTGADNSAERGVTGEQLVSGSGRRNSRGKSGWPPIAAFNRLMPKIFMTRVIVLARPPGSGHANGEDFNSGLAFRGIDAAASLKRQGIRN